MRNGITNLLASLDSYGQPIELNFRGKSRFQTPLGGLISLMVNIIVGWLTLVTFVEVARSEEMKI